MSLIVRWWDEVTRNHLKSRHADQADDLPGVGDDGVIERDIMDIDIRYLDIVIRFLDCTGDSPIRREKLYLDIFSFPSRNLSTLLLIIG